MEKPETEVKTQKLKAIQVEAARTVLIFERGDYEDKVSIFEPDIPKLEIGKSYTYTVRHVPTKEEGKFYHNVERATPGARRGAYKISPAVQPNTYSSPTKATPSQAATPTTQDARQDYWANKEKRDIERERIYELRLPYINAVNLMGGVGEIMGGMMQYKEGYDLIKKEGIDKMADTILRQLEGVVEKRLPVEAAYKPPKVGEKKSEKKEEPIEAEV